MQKAKNSQSTSADKETVQPNNENIRLWRLSTWLLPVYDASSVFGSGNATDPPYILVSSSACSK